MIISLQSPSSLLLLPREFKKLRRQLQRKRDIKIELCVKSSLLQLFYVDHVVQNRRSDFRLLCTNGFHVKANNERFIVASSRCRQNLKYENFTSSFPRVRQTIAPKSVRAARAARFFFFIQPIKSLICGVAVDVAAVKSLLLGSFSNDDDNGRENVT